MGHLRPLDRVLLVALLAMVVLVPLGALPAAACSYLQLSIDEALRADRHPSSAVVIVRRIDDGGDIHGEVEVVEVIRGEVPDTFPVTFDNGGSCHPSFGPGQVAGLLVNTTGQTPVVEQASQLSQDSVVQHLSGVLSVDTMASGDPAVVIAGQMPGGDLAVLDEHLRVLAVADTGSVSWFVEACGDEVVVLHAPGGESGVAAYRLADLTLSATAAVPQLAESSRQDMACVDGRVAAIANGTSTEFVVDGHGVLYPDVFGDASIEIPGFIEGTIAADRAVLLTASVDEGSELAVIGLDGEELRPRIEIPGERLYAVSLSPDGRTVAAWGADGVQLTIDTTSGEVRGRNAGGLDWVDQAWLGPDRLALSVAEGQTAGGSVVSIRDTALQEQGTMVLTGRPVATLAGMFALTDEGLLAVQADGNPIATAPSQTSLASTVAVVPGATVSSSPPTGVTATEPSRTEPSPTDEATATAEPPPIPPGGASAVAVVTAVLGVTAFAAAGAVLLAGRPKL